MKIGNNISTKEHWKLINHIINKFDNKSSPNYIINNTNMKIYDHKEIANAFNEHFINISQSINNQFKSNQYEKIPISYNLKKSIYLKPTTTEEINQIISSNKSKTSTDIDNLNMKILKITKDYIGAPLSNIFNLCISSKTFPEKLKTLIISPIFKKNENTDINNYRPISIIPQISKILERIIYNRIIDFITKNNIINQNQFGFIKKHNTTDAILDLYNHIILNKNKNKAINTVFIDLSKAFDTIDHIILLEILKHYGIRGITH